MTEPLTFIKQVDNVGQLVHLVDIDGVTPSGKLRCFITCIAEAKGSALHENVGYEQGTIASLKELRRRYKANGFKEG